tara:strand:+ start:368 stop:955 length:588 start_codon:yes stop_codon:yes gene_type:complete
MENVKNNPYFRGRKKWVWAKDIINDTMEFDPNLIREMQEGFCEAVDDHWAWIKGEPEGKQIDPEMLDWLQNAFRDLLSGNKSKFLETQKISRVRKKKTDHQIKLIEDALFYLKCVEQRLIQDPEPIKKIASLYGVSMRAVLIWIKSPEFEQVKHRDPHYYEQWKTGGRFDPVIAESVLESHGLMYSRLYSQLKRR